MVNVIRPSVPATPNVNYKRPELLKVGKKWALIQDCIDGEDAIKEAGVRYLPMPDATNCSEANLQRYKDYKKRAVFYNVIARTLSGMSGLVFQQDPDLIMPADMRPLHVNIDGAGITAFQQMRKALEMVVAFGRAGILADFPPAREGGFTRQQIADGEVQPTITLYEPWKIINWQTAYKDGMTKLVQVIIQEEIPGWTDGFMYDLTPSWRHLFINNDGIVVQRMWKNTGAPGTTDPSQGAVYVVDSEVIVKDSNGVPLTEIPFKFIGSKTNSPSIDPAPLFDLAVINIAHYRNSADYEESCFATGQPTVWASGLTEQWVKDVLGGELRLGSLGGIPLPVNGMVGMVQSSPNTQPYEAMKQKESQMIALGARLIQDNGMVERREVEVKNEASSEASLIISVAQNVEAAYQEALHWAGKFYGANPEAIALKINYNFIFAQMSYQERQQLLAEWVSGAISFTEMRTNLRQAGVANMPDAEAAPEIKRGLDERDLREIAKANATSVAPPTASPTSVTTTESQSQKVTKEPVN